MSGPPEHSTPKGSTPEDGAAPQARLAALDRKLARLRLQHDRAMSAFDFEAAIALGRDIAALEAEHAALNAAYPAPKPAPLVPVVPQLARPRVPTLHRRR